MKKLLTSLLCVGVLTMSSGVRAETVNVLDGLDQDIGPLTSFFNSKGITVDALTSSFTASDLAGVPFTILTVPTVDFSASQLSALDSYVDGGGRLLLNGEWEPNFTSNNIILQEVLTALGATITNTGGEFDPGFHDTTDILPSPFTVGVHDINYAATAAITGGTPLVIGDSGQIFIASEAIGSGWLFYIADSNTATNITSTTTNDNGVLYCNFSGLSCAATPAVPEPASLSILGLGLVGLGALRRRKLI